MKILILSKDLKGLGLAHQLKKEGHTVHLYAPNHDLSEYKGIFEIVDRVNVALQECKVVLADSPDWGHIEKQANAYNRTIIGSHKMLEVMNQDYIKRFDLMRKYGMKYAETVLFDDTGSVYKEILSKPKSRFVVRYKDKMYRCDYRDWVSWALDKIPLNSRVAITTPTLGVNISATGWFDGFDWLDTFTVAPVLDSRVYDYAMVRPIKPNNRIAKELKKLTAFLRLVDYHGPISMKFFVNGGGFVVDDIYVGIQYPEIYTIISSIRDDLGKFLVGVTVSSNYQVNPSNSYVATVNSRMMGEELVGAPVLGINPSRLKHSVFHHVTHEDDKYIVTADKEIVATATSFGATPEEASERCYNVIEHLRFPERHYDTTLLGTVAPTFTKLKELRII